MSQVTMPVPAKPPPAWDTASGAPGFISVTVSLNRATASSPRLELTVPAAPRT